MPARYIWRQLTPEQQQRLLTWRQDNRRPWHSPPHRPNFGHVTFLVHPLVTGMSRTLAFHQSEWIPSRLICSKLCASKARQVATWCILPNHYHLLLQSENILKLLHHLGRFHGRTSYQSNNEENKRGRQVFCRATERFLRSERHFFATLNYVHNNPVHHGMHDFGRNGHGAALQSIWMQQDESKPNAFGANTRCAITGRSGMIRRSRLGVPPSGGETHFRKVQDRVCRARF
jgi:putative transposase